MLVTAEPVPARVGELAKLPAFLRRDLLIAWSYRTALVTDLGTLIIQAVLFALVARLVDPATLPTFGGRTIDYAAFVATGLTVAALFQLGITKLVAVTRQEQLTGTLESLYATPTRPGTIQAGSALYDLVTIPVRTGLFLAFVAVALDVSLSWGGALPAAIVLLAAVPAAWGIGLLGAASVMTFRHGTAVTALAVGLLSLGSGVYLPLEILPGWVARAAGANPFALALDTIRDLLLGGAGWERVGPTVAVLVPASAVGLMLGSAAMRWALRRERRRGTLGQY